MRLWSIHPRYLDAAGLTACWREGLLARKVLAGETRGYRNHPQLDRFRRALDPVAAVDTYLAAIYGEALCRGYRFNRALIGPDTGVRLAVTRGQLGYEAEHLGRKLARRDPARLALLADGGPVEPHPMFDVVEGAPEAWEKIG